ncbi:MAG TPA: hypothetical protein VNI60_07940 [Pyrinomonadaceae bacterium]|nr:hypothetical protein [Pyrinomonadaceae bacterium]
MKTKLNSLPGKNLKTGSLLIICLTFVTFGQEKAPPEKKADRTTEASRQVQTPQSTPEAKKPARERKVEESNKPAIPAKDSTIKPPSMFQNLWASKQFLIRAKITILD